jgi:putative membrane protein
LTIEAPRLESSQQDQLDAIRKASGQDADRLYLNAQRNAHEEALALHQAYAADGTQPDLKKVAEDIAQVVQQHQDMLAKLSS